MKRIKTLTEKTMKSTVVKGGCGECQTSCQSACKTSCTVGNLRTRKGDILRCPLSLMNKRNRSD